MINLLSKLFIKNYQDTKNQEVRKEYGILMSIIGIVANVFLSLAKFVVGTVSGSISITADALNNFSDAGTQIISLISFKISAKPADRGHPFGHARMEYVASMIVSFLILLVSIELGKESISKIFHPVKSEFSASVIIVLSVSIFVKLWLGISSRQVAKKIDSMVIRATASDSFSDVLATLAVLISALICHFTSFHTDAYMGLIVSAMIFVAGIKILNETKNFILGSQPDPEVINGIFSISREYPDIIGIHDVIVHNYGAGNTIASLHAEVDGAKDVYYIHDVIDKMEKQLYSELGVQATIHMDPTITNDEDFLHLRRLISKAARLVDSSVSIHDCHYVPDEINPKLAFDIVVPYELKRSDTEICSAMQATISELNPNLLCEITVDRR